MHFSSVMSDSIKFDTKYSLYILLMEPIAFHATIDCVFAILQTIVTCFGDRDTRKEIKQRKQQENKTQDKHKEHKISRHIKTHKQNDSLFLNKRFFFGSLLMFLVDWEDNMGDIKLIV